MRIFLKTVRIPVIYFSQDQFFPGQLDLLHLSVKFQLQNCPMLAGGPGPRWRKMIFFIKLKIASSSVIYFLQNQFFLSLYELNNFSVKFQLQCFPVLSGVAGSRHAQSIVLGRNLDLNFLIIGAQIPPLRPLPMTRKAVLNVAKHSQLE